jgi:hypothetical protein
MVFFILISVPALLFSLFWTARPAASALAQQSPMDAGTPWYHPAWLYRRLVTVNSGSALSNYQVLLTFTSLNFPDFANTNDNGTDLRFTKSDGLTELPFWIESWDKINQIGYVWVKVDALAIGSTPIYLYYGYTGAVSASRGDLTFELFDDNWCQFPGGSCGPTNPVQTATQAWWENYTSFPMVFEDTSFAGRPRYHMLYDGHGVAGILHAKGYAWSSDLINWTEYDDEPYPPNPIMGDGFVGDAQFAWGDAVKVGSTYYMFPSRGPGITQRVESTDLIHWTNFTTLVEDDPIGNIGTGAAILKEPDGITPVVVDGQYWMVYFRGGSPGTMYMASSPAAYGLDTWTFSSSWSLAPSASGFDAAGLWTPSFIRFGDMYYIYYQGQTSGGLWETGYARASATVGGNPVAPNSGSITWSKSGTGPGDDVPDSVLKRGSGGSWDSGGAIDPMVRQFSDGVYYLFYTGMEDNGYATASAPEGPWTKLGVISPQWTGSAPVSGGILTLGNSVGVISIPTFQNMAVGYRANFGVGNGLLWGGFINGYTNQRTMIGSITNIPASLYLKNYVSGESTMPLCVSNCRGSYHEYEVLWRSGNSVGLIDHGAGSATLSTQVPAVALPVTLRNHNNSTNPLLVDWVYVRQYSYPEPTAAISAAESCAPTTVYVDDDYAPGLVGAYIWNCSAFDTIHLPLDYLNSATTIHVADGTYTESLTVDRTVNVSMTVSGNIALIGNLSLQDGTFNAPAGTLSIYGDFTRSGGTFNHNSGTIVFTGAGTHNLDLSSLTAFNNLTVDTGDTLVETVSADNAGVAGTLINNGTIRKPQSIITTGAQSFGLAGVTIDITSLAGADPLTDLVVDRIDQDHPNGTGNGDWGTNTGRYWTITPTGGDYIVTLTLPHNLDTQSQPSVCRYDGPEAPGLHWNCDRTGSDASTVTRAGIAELSDWAVGNDVGPTAVKIASLNATAANGKVLLVTIAAGLVALLGVVVLFWHRRVLIQR